MYNSHEMKIKSFCLMLSVALLFGCATYSSTRKAEVANPSKETGKAFVREALQHYEFVKDPEVVSLVNRIGYRLVKAIGSNPESYHFLVVHELQPNAFAIPGGYIFVFDGLLTQIKNEDELAGVLAHEMGHVERNHFFKDSKKIAALDIATIAAILLGGGNMAAATIAGAANLDVRLQFSRENEAEADTYALKYLEQGGYSPRALLDFFDDLIRYERFNPQSAPAYMSTHPDLESRRNKVANFILRGSTKTEGEETLGKTAVRSKMDWERVLAILISRDQKRTEESSLLQILDVDEMPAEVRDEMRNYLLGVAYMKAGQYDEAIIRYHSAIERNQESPVYYTDLAFCYLKQQDLPHAREAALQSLKLKGDYAQAHLILGMLDQDSGNVPSAITHLEEAIRIEPGDLMANFNLAMAYRASGDAAREAFYTARYLRINLNPQGALSEFNRAKGVVAESTPLYFRIAEEIDEIKREGL